MGLFYQVFAKNLHPPPNFICVARDCSGETVKIYAGSPEPQLMAYQINTKILCKIATVNVLNFLKLFSFCSQIKCCFLELEFTKCFSEMQTGKTLIRLLLQDPIANYGLHCLSRTFWQTTSVYNLRTFTVLYMNNKENVTMSVHVFLVINKKKKELVKAMTIKLLCMLGNFS